MTDQTQKQFETLMFMRSTRMLGQNHRKQIPIFLVVLASLVLCALTSSGQNTREVAKFRGEGLMAASVTGPGPNGRGQRIYASHLYYNQPFSVISIDPDTGATREFRSPLESEQGARCMIKGADGNIYLGTLPHAHFMMLDTAKEQLIDLGQPDPNANYIWDLALGSDQRIYGGTYPDASLISYDPKTRSLKDIGRVDPIQQYAHWLGADNDGFIYVGIGTAKANIGAYNTANGELREILPSNMQVATTAFVFRGEDGRVYAHIGDFFVRCEGGQVTQIDVKQYGRPENRMLVGPNRTAAIHDRKLAFSGAPSDHPGEVPVQFAGQRELEIFRIGWGPKGVLYGSTILPMHLFEMNSTGQTSRVTGLGNGEVYSFLRKDPWLLIAAYGSTAPLWTYDPSKPVQTEGPQLNPSPVKFSGGDISWRPEAMVEGRDGFTYIGSVPTYGQRAGAITVWNAATGEVQSYSNVVTDQSVVSLAVWQGLIVGGSSIHGGEGTQPTQRDAKVFIWDPSSKTSRGEIVPVSGAETITDLLVVGNKLYGFADSTLFRVNLDTRAVELRSPAPFKTLITNSIGVAPDGTIWGLAAEGIFRIDPANDGIQLVERTTVTGGFAMDPKVLYYVSHSSIKSFQLPEFGRGRR